MAPAGTGRKANTSAATNRATAAAATNRATAEEAEATAEEAEAEATEAQAEAATAVTEFRTAAPFSTVREIVERGDLIFVDGTTYLVAPVSPRCIDALSAFEAEAEDREPEPLEPSIDGHDDLEEGAALWRT